MGALIMREETVSALRECVLIAEDLHLFGLREALLAQGLIRDIPHCRKARHVFDKLLTAVDWTNPKAIEPIVHIFEDAYAESPIASHTIHARVDAELRRDGLKFEDGRIIDLGLKPRPES